jgi:phosphatidylglycerophosphatase A
MMLLLDLFCSKKKNKKKIVENFLAHLATVFGMGCWRPAPGTWGSLLALPLGFFLMPHVFTHMLVCFVGVFIAVWSAHSYLKKQAYDQQEENSDPSEVIIDEVVGMLVALVWLPQNWVTLAMAFIIFRLLDILKPFPISWFDQKGRGGLGIVVDDIVAGLITNIGIHFLLAQGWWLV